MNVLALDIGEKRVGIAYSNTSTKVSSPIKVVSLNEILSKSKNFTDILYDYIPQKFIIGLPKSLDGNINNQAKKIKDIAKKIYTLYNIEYEFVDERLSSKEAKNILKQQGLSEKQMRGKIDSVAASLFLENWLNKQ